MMANAYAWRYLNLSSCTSVRSVGEKTLLYMCKVYISKQHTLSLNSVINCNIGSSMPPRRTEPHSRSGLIARIPQFKFSYSRQSHPHAADCQPYSRPKPSGVHLPPPPQRVFHHVRTASPHRYCHRARPCTTSALSSSHIS